MNRMPYRSCRISLKNLAMWLSCLALAGALAACGSTGGSGGPSSASTAATPSSSAPGSTQSCSGSCGSAVVTLTDAAGDFLSYIVNIDSLELTRSDGTVVQVVPVTTQVDFARLVDLSEVVSAAQVPAGRYVSASLTLDYNGATIVVDNGTTGVTIAPSDIINGATSLPLAAPNPTQMTLTLSLPSSEPLVVAPNTIANLALDFNLLASNTVAPSATDPTTVTVNPVLTASLVPDATKNIAVRGPLVTVDTQADSYTVGVRPFYSTSGTSGQLTVTTTENTTYSINGTAYSGSAGLTQLAALPAGTLTLAYGTWDLSSQTFTASTVLAGSSVPGTSLDSVEGTVISRTGDTLTLAAGLMFRPGMNGIAFAPQVTVTVGSATTVSEQGMSGSFSAQDISVGQQGQFLGKLSSDAPGSATLDATAGSANLLLTQAVGTVVSSTAGQVTINLQSLAGRSPSIFNFAGTGASSAQDATPTAYTISVPAALSTTGLTASLPASFAGFITPFGSAPPDFSTTSVVNYSQTNALLNVRWATPGVTSPFATLTSSELLISAAMLQSSAQDTVRIASVVLNPSSLSGGLQIVPNTAATNPQFAIAHRMSWTVDSFNTFSDFVTALTTELNGTNEALQVIADGPYDATTGVLSANQAVVVTND